MHFQLLACQICFTCNSSRPSKPSNKASPPRPFSPHKPLFDRERFRSACTSKNARRFEACLRTYLAPVGYLSIAARLKNVDTTVSSTIIWSRGGGQSEHVLARWRKEHGTPRISPGGLFAQEAPEKPGVKSRAGCSLRNTRNACRRRRRRLCNRYRSPGPGKRRDNVSSFSRGSIFSLFSPGNERGDDDGKRRGKRMRGARQISFFFFRTSRSEAHSRGNTFLLFFFLLFLFREALSPRACSISPTEFRHVNGKKDGKKASPAFRR